MESDYSFLCHKNLYPSVPYSLTSETLRGRQPMVNTFTKSQRPLYNSSNKAFASCKSGVSNPSVNQA
jgi:hypothetical protein